MNNNRIALDSMLKALEVKPAVEKTDDEFEKDNVTYGNVVDDLDIMENDMLTKYRDLDVDTYLKLRQIDLLKKIVDKLDNIEMIYDVYNELKKLNNK